MAGYVPHMRALGEKRNMADPEDKYCRKPEPGEWEALRAVQSDNNRYHWSEDYEPVKSDDSLDRDYCPDLFHSVKFEVKDYYRRLRSRYEYNRNRVIGYMDEEYEKEALSLTQQKRIIEQKIRDETEKELQELRNRQYDQQQLQAQKIGMKDSGAFAHQWGTTTGSSGQLLRITNDNASSTAGSAKWSGGLMSGLGAASGAILGSAFIED